MTMQRFLLSYILFAVCALSVITPLTSAALEADYRVKWFSTGSALPKHDIQRSFGGTPLYDHTFDVRLMFEQTLGPVRLLAHHSTIWLNGDTLALGENLSAAVDQTVVSDERRLMDLTWHIDEGGRHNSLHRLDRLALQWQPGDWRITLGRQAVSWGSGIVFQPMDLFSPFSPTVVDRDYKGGEDVLLVDKLLNNGQDLQFLHVVRRDAQGDLAATVNSSALKWHGYLAAWEFEALAAEHYDETVLGFSVKVPLGQALLRSDVVATRYRALNGQRDWRVSGLVNVDVTLTVVERNAYVFAEYFHNAFGVSQLPETAFDLPPELQFRLERGELFNLMKDYLAVGGSLEWHPLISQSLTLIANLHDSSSLMQMQLSFEPSDQQSVQVGWIEPLGRAGDEFGGVPVVGRLNSQGNVLPSLTSGGASRFYLRWVYFL